MRKIKLKSKNIIFCFIILILSFTNIILCFSNSSVSALSYENSVSIGFTFNPTLSVNLSSSDLVIPNLTPGSNSDSNSINVNITTNASYGYALSVSSSSDNLIHSNNTNTFSGIATDANLANLTTDNTWGYSTSLDNGSTWSNYNGLSSSSSTILIDKDDNTSSNIDFKIGAKASATQTSGAYTNTINFIAVSKVAPTSLLDAFIASGASQLNGYYKMQDMTHDICNNVDDELIPSELQLIDERDNKIYWVAKLKDGNCWMTQNLDLDLSHEVALTSETSDINPESYGTTIYTAETGYAKDDTTGTVSWLPSTIDENGIQRADTIDMVWNGNRATVPGWSNNNSKPYSANTENRYRYTDTSGNETVYASLNTCLANTNNDKAGCQHSHLGNYYNWPASVASNDTNSINKPYDNAANSICPKNWRLPIYTEYGDLLQAQEVWPGSSYNYSTNGYLKIRISPLYFVLSGVVGNLFDNTAVINYFYPTTRGWYWTSTAENANLSYDLYFNNNNIFAQDQSYLGKGSGFSVRCLTK